MIASLALIPWTLAEDGLLAPETERTVFQLGIGPHTALGIEPGDVLSSGLPIQQIFLRRRPRNGANARRRGKRPTPGPGRRVVS